MALGVDRVDRNGDVVGDGWPDAVGAAALAAGEGRPILLTGHDAVSPETLDVIDTLGVEDVTVVGGTAAILPAVDAQLSARGLSTDRVAGTSRFETARAVADRAIAAGADPTRLWIATGRAFPDALTAGPAVAADGGVLLLAETGDPAVNGVIVDYLVANGEDIDTVRLIGGSSAISDDLAVHIEALLFGSGR